MMYHNDFPKMTEEFDRSVRRALDSLPERESKPVRRFSAKKIVCAGLAAALCIGGTAFAANAQSWFPLLFPNGGDANLEGYVQTADNAKLTDENEHYRLSVESVLFDESAGTGDQSAPCKQKAGRRKAVYARAPDRQLPEQAGYDMDHAVLVLRRGGTA